MRKRHAWPTFLVAASLSVAGLMGVAGASSNPAPGTADDVAHLVAASTSIRALSSSLVRQLADVTADVPSRIYPSVGTIHVNNCVTVTGCVFGDLASTRVVVLYGDSHAFMWLPALVPNAIKDHVRLVMLWQGTCPVAHLHDYYYVSSVVNTQCASWTASIVPAIKKLKPTLVLLGERTAEVRSSLTGKLFTDAQWRAALEPAITQFQTPHTTVAIIEDIPYLDFVPSTCLAAYPTRVQSKCSVPSPNPQHPGQQAAERAAARATGAGFIVTTPWLCSSRCSPVIGHFFSYFDQGHLSTTYAQYLATVMGTDLAALLRSR